MFEPREFVTFAEGLATQRAMAEVAIRNCVSRAYYGAFLVTRERLVELRWFTPTRTAADHGLVVHTLRTRGDPALASIGHLLQSLRKNRNQADYDLRWVAAEVDAHLAARSARAVLNDLDNLLPS